MRKLKLQMQITLDGFISGINGEIDWMLCNWDDELKKYITELTENVDTIVLGRNLAQGFIPHWKTAAKTENDWFSNKMNDSKKVVFTKTLHTSEWEHTELAKGELVTEINKLKKQEGKDIIAYGGGTFVSSLIHAGLIDEYPLFVTPTAIGKGITIFGSVHQNQNFKLLQSKAFDCGIVLLCYKPENKN